MKKDRTMLLLRVGTFLYLAVAALAAACGSPLQTSCLVIDAAHAACAVITVPDGKGGTEEVKVTREELVGVVRRVKAERAAAAPRASAP